MNKVLVAVGIAITAIISPFAAMGIGETRSVLLGLAPEEQITALADKIDTNRATNDQKLSDLQALVSTQQVTIDEQNMALEAQNTSQSKELIIQQAELTAISAKVTKQDSCAKLRSDSPFCSLGRYANQKSFDKYLDFRKDSSTDEINTLMSNFSKCQKISSSC